MRSGTTSPWAIAEPSPQVALSSICPSAVSLKPPPETLRGDQRLDQHRHRGVGRIEAVVLHVAPRIGGPQRGPAGAHRGEEIGFAVEAEEALELPGEIGAGAILDQRRRAHHPERALLALRPPCGQQRLEDLRRDRRLIELEPDLHRDAACLRRAQLCEAADQRIETEPLALPPVGGRRQAEAARRRQAGARKRARFAAFGPTRSGSAASGAVSGMMKLSVKMQISPVCHGRARPGHRRSGMRLPREITGSRKRSPGDDIDRAWARSMSLHMVAVARQSDRPR